MVFNSIWALGKCSKIFPTIFFSDIKSFNIFRWETVGTSSVCHPLIDTSFESLVFTKCCYLTDEVLRRLTHQHFAHISCATPEYECFSSCWLSMGLRQSAVAILTQPRCGDAIMGLCICPNSSKCIHYMYAIFTSIIPPQSFKKQLFEQLLCLYWLSRVRAWGGWDLRPMRLSGTSL